jgi:phosphoribosylcarboxyaminoimidazole (NCAIR) mutase
VSETEQPLVGVVMGSDSDWPTMEKAVEVLKQFGVPYEARVVSAHRTPELLVEYSKSSHERGLKSHYCRSWWSGAPSWDGGFNDDSSGAWRSG